MVTSSGLFHLYGQNRIRGLEKGVSQALLRRALFGVSAGYKNLRFIRLIGTCP